MGEYAKTCQKIAELKKERRKIQSQIKGLEKWADNLRDKINDIDLLIADCWGYILEIDAIDNTDPAAPHYWDD